MLKLIFAKIFFIFCSFQVISCLAEAPEGRKSLLEEVENIKKLVDDPVPIVAKHAAISVRIITWKP